MPIALGTPLFLGHTFLDSYHPSFSSLLGIQNLFFVGILGTMVIAPERFQFGAGTTAWTSGIEFLLTRSIDRPVFYRSRAAFLYVLVLLMPLTSLLYSLDHPDLKVTEYSSTAREQCLNMVPGTSLEKDPSGNISPLIVIRRGNVLIEEWHLWLFLTSVVGVQALILLLYPLKYRLFIFYIVYFSFVFAPLYWDLHNAYARTLSVYQRPFFFFATHQVLFWILTVLVVALAQLWCERLFARLEQ